MKPCLSPPYDKYWSPLLDPQEMAYRSLADELFYGSAAGGGKTDLLLGLVLREYRYSIIFRCVYLSLKCHSGVLKRDIWRP
jgi:hypothetical protein